MRIHQITHLFHPDSLAGASLYTDLATFFRSKGHDVRVTTTFSYYPQLQYRAEDRDVFVRDEVFGGIPLRRVAMWLPRNHRGVMRLIPEVTYLAGLSLFGRIDGWRPDVVITACPMLAQVICQQWLYMGRRVPRLVIVQDLMAHAATELGIVKSSVMGALLKRIERQSLRRANRICTISLHMKRRIDSVIGGRSQCSVVPNWIHQGLADGIAARSAVVKKVTDPTLFYSGNFGVKQGLPAFLESFRQARGNWRIRLNGGGAEAETLRHSTAGCGDWLSMGGLLAESEYVDRLLEATACVITQQSGVGANFLPSKLLPALAAGLPVLAVCDADSPLGVEVIEGEIGEVVPPGDTEGLRLVLRRWRSDPSVLDRFSRCALKRAANYSRESICQQYLEILEELAAQPGDQ